LIKKVVIPSAGLGTRLLPATKQQPKEMLPLLLRGVDGQLCLKPLLQVVFENLFDANFREFHFITGRGKRSIEDHFTVDNGLLKYLEACNNNGSMRELFIFYEKIRKSSIVFINQAEPRGFGDAVYCAKSPIGKNDFLVHAGDDLVISKDNRYLLRMMQIFDDKKAAAVFCAEEVDDPTNYGVIIGQDCKNNTILVKKVIEKPKASQSKLAIVAIYLFAPEIFDAIEQTPTDSHNEVQLTTAIQRLIESGRPVYAVKLSPWEERVDIGSPLSYFNALNRLSQIGQQARHPCTVSFESSMS
jgi:UTP--glucose-1-phosphate uridylyltransferase